MLFLCSWLVCSFVSFFCVELSWWEKGSVENSSGGKVEFVFTPAQHWCQRGVFDRNKVCVKPRCTLFHLKKTAKFWIKPFNSMWSDI